MTRPYRNRFSAQFSMGVLSLAFIVPGCAPATVLFSNLGTSRSYDITAGNPIGNAFDGNIYAEADTFKPSASGSLNSIGLALSCVAFCPSADPISIAITADIGNRPGTALERFSVAGNALGLFGVRNPALMLNSVLHPLLLINTRYWITVSSGMNDAVAWNLNTSGDMSDAAISTDEAVTWFSPSGETPGALEVNATVPEPVSAGFLMEGVLAVCAWRKLKLKALF